MNPNVIITSHGGAEKILSVPISKRAPVKYVISIGEEGSSPPSGFSKGRSFKKLRLEFDDVEYDHFWYTGCTEKQVKSLVEFAWNMTFDTKNMVLVHCAAGYSRSTAAAGVVFTSLFGIGRDKEAMKRIGHAVRWSVDNGYRDDAFFSPNRRVIYYADEVLGRGGALWEAFNEVYGSTYHQPLDTSRL